MKDQPIDRFVDQGTLAAMLDIDRSQILALQKRGLPYTAGAKGGSNRYDISLAIHWYVGHQVTIKHDIRLTALQKILWGLAHGGGCRSFTVWKTRMLNQSDWLQVSREEVATAAGFLLGSKLLPWSHY